MQITIITDPLPIREYIVINFSKKYLRKIINYFIYNKYKVFRGHYAVTRSLVEGLKKLNIIYNYNPNSLTDIYENVIVLSNCVALGQVIELKKRGVIKNILAGPNIFIYPTDCKFICDNNINYCITPSKWVSDIYIKTSPCLENKCIEWPAGVDTNLWNNFNVNSKKKVTFYIKGNYNSNLDLEFYIYKLFELGINKNDIYIIRVGSGFSYNESEYLQALKSSFALIVFSLSESQGIALAESWSMNVPTLILRNTKTFIKDKEITTSNAPYLNSENGKFFNNADELNNILSSIMNNNLVFNPRKWVLENMSDEICAKKLLNIFIKLNLK